MYAALFVFWKLRRRHASTTHVVEIAPANIGFYTICNLFGAHFQCVKNYVVWEF